ncbi:MAG: glycosyltransferase family 4 protein [Methylococcales bacterium]|nr:glycosyltransferase family 4 protein [Methylococcales bacterium]
MRILFINSLYPPYIGGGAEITLSNLVNGLLQRGHEIAVLSTHGGRGLEASIVNGVKIYRAAIRNIYWPHSSPIQPSWKRLIWHAIDGYNPLAGNDIRRIINEFRPEIISCHNLSGFSKAAWNVAVNAKVPVVQVLHDYYSICPKSTMFNNGRNCEKPCVDCTILRLPHAHASNKLHAVVGVSHAVLGRHLQAGFFADVPIKKVIYNERTLKEPKLALRNQDTLTFGFIGALTVVKGIAQLAEAFIRIAAQCTRQVRLLIGGSGTDDYVAELKRRYASDHILFLGQVDPAAFFNQIDVTVVPSLWHEPLGMVVAESLGFSVPVIGAKRGGIPEMIQHEKNGLIYDPDKPYALDAVMLRIIEEPTLLMEMRNNAVPSASNFLNEDRMIIQHERLYKEITG